MNGTNLAAQSLGGGGVNMAWQVVQIVVCLAAVAALAWLTTRLLARQRMAAGRAGHLALVDSLPLGKDRHVCLVRAGREYLLLGVAEHQITLLREGAAPSHNPDQVDADTGLRPERFATRFREVLDRLRPDREGGRKGDR